MIVIIAFWRNVAICGLLAVALSPTARADDAVRIVPQAPATNYFGDRDVRWSFHIIVDKAATGNVLWEYLAGQRTIARGESRFDATPERPASVAIALRLPPVKDGVVFPTQLKITAMAADEKAPLANFESPVWLFPENPLTDRSTWLEELKLALYDPAGETAALWDEEKIAYTWLRNLAALAERKEGLVVIGEGVSPEDEPELPAAVFAKVAAGVPVLWLAPAAGDLPLTELVQNRDVAEIQWRRSDVIAALDKRLDALAWDRGGEVPLTTLRLTAKKDEIIAEVDDDPLSWPWLDVRFRLPGARLIVCGFSVVAAWPQSPTPRFLFVRMLEELAPKAQSDQSIKKE